MKTSKGLKAFQKEVKKQRKEHPWASTIIINRIARDHVRKGGR